MLEQGYDEEEIKRKVASYREILKEKDPEISKVGKTDGDSGKNFAETSHEIAKLNEAQQKKLRSAFGIDREYKSGMAFNSDYSAFKKGSIFCPEMSQTDQVSAKNFFERRLQNRLKKFGTFLGFW